MNKKVKIIITPQFGIGDALLSTPAIKILKENLKNSEITYFTFNRAIYEIFKTNKDIDKVIYFPILEMSRLKSLIFILKNLSFKYDICINFYPSNRREYNIFSYLTFAKKRLGHKYKCCNFSQLNWLKNYTIYERGKLHCVEENVRLLKFLDISIDKKDIPQLLVYFREEELRNVKDIIGNIKSFKNLIGIHPGTSIYKNQDKRRWSKENFLKLIKYLIDKKNKIFIFGGKDDVDVLNYLKKELFLKNIFFVENKNIREVCAIIKNLNLFISNDSGLMHIAAACKTPIVGIFGPTNPIWVHPWKVPHEIVKSDVECSPCFVYSPEPLYCKKKDKKYECLKKISVDMVIEKVEKLL